MSSSDIKLLVGSSSIALGEEIGARLGSEPLPVRIERHANGSTGVLIEESVSNCHVFVVQSCGPPVNENFMELVVLVDAARRAGAGYVTAVVPYYPYVRSNRTNNTRRSLTAELVGRLLAEAGTRSIMSLDLISDQVEGYCKSFTHLTCRSELAKSLSTCGITSEQAVVVALDVLSVRNSIRLSHAMGIHFAGLLYKHRNPDGSRVRHGVLQGIEQRAVILYDDEIDSGSSMIQGTGYLLDHGASEVYAASPHGLFLGAAVDELSSSPLARTHTSDSVAPAVAKCHPKIDVFSTAGLFASAIEDSLSF